LFTHGLPNFATIDVSFISLRLILPVLKTLLEENSEIVALIKPQFEAEKEQVGKKGIIRDKKLHVSIVKQVLSFAEDSGFECLQLDYSPITGTEGNIEFLAHLGYKTDKAEIQNIEQEIVKVVEDAHAQLTRKSLKGE